MIGLGWEFQSYHAVLKDYIVRVALRVNEWAASLPLKSSWTSLMSIEPLCSVLPLLETPNYAISLMLIVMIGSSCVRDVWTWWQTEESTNWDDAPQKIQISKIKYHFPRDTEGNGVVVEFKGSKPAGMCVHRIIG